jgi:ribonuclease Y
MVLAVALASVLALAAGAGLTAVIQSSRHRKHAARIVAEAEARARETVAHAEREAQEKVREAALSAQEKVHQLRNEFETASREAKKELQQQEKRLQQRESKLDQRQSQADKADNDLKNREKELEKRTQALAGKEARIAELVGEQQAKLEALSGLTAEQAKKELIGRLEQDARLEAAQMIKRLEEEAVEHANARARNILSATMQKIASEYVAENTVSVVDLPSDEMKGRIIGREGRNIRALELAAGVDLIVDDTPGAVTISSFDPMRRELAGMALKRLVQDGRIHPGRIEEVVEKCRAELDTKVMEEGEAAAMEVGIPDLHIDIIKHLGKLKFRTSYGQNVLSHAKEVSRLAEILARELGADQKVAKRAGLLHDIGKAIDREMEGTHIQLGVDFLRRMGESESVIHAMECHHGDVEPRMVEAVLVTIADALSAARPGARRDVLESYVRRLEKLEGIAGGFQGVNKAYAVQAGRELRIIVESAKITDEQAFWMAKDVARKIEGEVQYPGQIKVTVIRETRAIDYAK